MQDPNHPPALPPPPVEGGLTTIRIDPVKLSTQVGMQITFVVWGAGADGNEVDVTASATFTSADVALLAPVAGSAAKFEALAPGDVKVQATVEELTASSDVNIVDGRMPVAITLSAAELELGPRATGMVTANLSWTDGTNEDITATATWSSSAPSIATVAAGLVTRVASGMATITVAHLNLQASLQIKDPPAAPCSYPTGQTGIRMGSTMPNVSWSGAYHKDGTQFDFSLEDIHCGAEYQDKTVLIFIVGAGWCGPCSQYAQDIAPDGDDIEAAGGVIIFVEAQDANYNAATNAYANSHLTHLIGARAGIRVGDGETMPRASTFNDASVTTQFPTAFVVRKSDMKMIALQTDWNSMLPYANIARHPDEDWSHPNRPQQAPNCGASDEEMGEPNDTAAQATPIMAGNFMGGVCNAQGDFYQINHMGNWTLDLEFSHSIGDIDTFVWDAATDAPARIGGQTVGSDSGDDDESFSHQGPALVKVYGYEGATAPYLLRLTTN